MSALRRRTSGSRLQRWRLIGLSLLPEDHGSRRAGARASRCDRGRRGSGRGRSRSAPAAAPPTTVGLGPLRTSTRPAPLGGLEPDEHLHAVRDHRPAPLDALCSRISSTATSIDSSNPAGTRIRALPTSTCNGAGACLALVPELEEAPFGTRTTRSRRTPVAAALFGPRLPRRRRVLPSRHAQCRRIPAENPLPAQKSSDFWPLARHASIRAAHSVAVAMACRMPCTSHLE